jgi:SAM-dependent methyltransferase
VQTLFANSHGPQGRSPSNSAVLTDLICVRCASPLSGNLHCDKCGSHYSPNGHGYLELLAESHTIETTTNGYADEQHCAGRRVFHQYLKPLLDKEPFDAVLDAGCGMGEAVVLLRSAGIKAYGVDLPCLSPFWAKADRDRNSFFCANVCRLPFADNYFDVVCSFGVIEHVGTILGMCTLAPDYWQKRATYAGELIRVTKPNGRIILACPNKSFPIDIQHGPTDALSAPAPIRDFILQKTGMQIHKTWGSSPLVSVREVKELFSKCRSLEALPLRNYFGFGRFGQGFLRGFGVIAKTYIDYLPWFARSTCLNPYVLVQLRK